MTRAKGTGKVQKGDTKCAPKKPRAFVLKNPDFATDAEKAPTLRQERFILEYLRDFDSLRALRAAGYTFKNDASGYAQASHLLNLHHIAIRVAERKAQIAEKLGLDAEGCLRYLKLVVLEALSARDWHAAIAALREIGRLYGAYDKDNTQRFGKILSPEECERLKAELEMRGWDFSRRNFPAHLVGVPPGQSPRVLPANTTVENAPPERHQ